MGIKVEVLPSSMYQLMGATNPNATVLLGLLGFIPDDCPRFRDAYLDPTGTRITILTRTGDESEYFHANETLREHRDFIDSEQDKFDRTYMRFYYDVPRDSLELARDLAAKQIQPYPTVKERINAAISEMKSLKRADFKIHPRFSVIEQVLKRVSKSSDVIQITDPDM